MTTSPSSTSTGLGTTPAVPKQSKQTTQAGSKPASRLRYLIGGAVWIAISIIGTVGCVILYGAKGLGWTPIWILVGFCIHQMIVPFDPGPYGGGFPGEW